MKIVLAGFLLLFSSQAFSYGRLGFKKTVSPSDGESNYSMGLNVYEPVVSSVAYVSWTGYGMDPERKDWFKTEQRLEYTLIPDLVVGTGVNALYTPSLSELDMSFNLQV